MKEFFKNFKIPIILGGCALIAIVATLLVITGGGGGGYGLYLSSANGSVSVTNSDVVTDSAIGDKLKNGDIITVGADSSCTLAYKGRKNSEQNYLVLGENSQIVVSGDFDGKTENNDLFLRSGSVIGNFAGEDRSPLCVRTSDAMITTVRSVSKISYSTDEFTSYTDLYTFMGGNTIQLYDEMGNPVNNAELQIEKRWGQVASKDGPYFESLNLEFDLDKLTAFDLKTLISIANVIGEDFPYTVEELKAAYDAKGGDEPEETETTTTETTSDSSNDIQTAEPIETSAPPTETTLPGHTTAAPQTTTQAPATTQPPVTETTAAEQTTANGVTHTVTVIIDGEETIQEIAHGEDAVKPEDPDIEGLTFIGWDGSFENITEDRIITAMFDEFVTETSASGLTHTVTVVIGNRSNTLTVEHGKSANLPNTLNIEGYVFKGWDKDFTNITEDITITAILEPVTTHTVTFVIENDTFPVQTEHGGSVLPPFIPTADSKGNRFVGWDKSLSNIVNDTTITAVFATGEYHTVTFIIDGQFYSVSVPDGGTAEPPFWPVTDTNGNRFTNWDRSLDNITSDVTITAYFE